MGSIFSISQSVHQTRDLNDLRPYYKLFTAVKNDQKLHLPVEYKFPDNEWTRDPTYRLSDKAIALAQVVDRIVNGTLVPPGREGLLMVVPGVCTGFRPVGPDDLATKFQFVVFPHRFIPTVHDLTSSDIFLIMSLVKHTKEYVWANWGSYKEMQLGFLKDAGIGYLHMHVLIGPLTEHGWSKRHEWVNVYEILDKLSHN